LKNKAFHYRESAVRQPTVWQKHEHGFIVGNYSFVYGFPKKQSAADITGTVLSF